MSEVKDLIGQRFGRLTVIKSLDGSRNTPRKQLCKCACGNITSVITYKLISGHTKSCGCLQRERTSNASKKHGLRHTKLYKTWCNMKNRCNNVNNQDYHSYGGRGIFVCDEWRNDFKSFYDWAMSNGYQDDLTIDRIDVNGNYEPNNCRWISNKAQSRNKRNTVKLEVFNEIRPLIEWCEIFNKDYQHAYDILIRYKKMNPNEYFGGKCL